MQEYSRYVAFLFSKQVDQPYVLDMLKRVYSIFAASDRSDYFEHTVRLIAHSNSLKFCDDTERKLTILSVLLHDIGITVDPSYAGHPGQSANLVEKHELLSQLEASEKEVVLDAIKNHHPKPDEFLTNRICNLLCDIDAIDIIGPRGVYRWNGRAVMDEAISSSSRLFLKIVEESRAARGSFFRTEVLQKEHEAMLDFAVNFHTELLTEIIS